MNEQSTPLSKQLVDANKAVYMYYKYLWNRTHRYQYNTAQVVTGSGGTGKTMFSVLSAFIINSKRFDERNYVNSAREFIQAVDDSKSGDSLVWDEVGVSLSSRKWHSLGNILTAETLQTYRRNKLTVFFVSPDFSFMDVQARKLMTIFCEIQRYDVSKSIVRLYDISINRREGEIYWKTYRMVMNNILYKMPKMFIPRRVFKKIPINILKGIKEKEESFKTKIRKQSLKIIAGLEKEEQGERTLYDIINTVAKTKEEYTNTKGKLDWRLVSIGQGISRDKAQQVITFIEKNP